MITIDDGWRDGYTYARPIMQKYGFVATYFVIAGRIGSPSFLGPDDLRELVAAGNEIGDHTVDHLRLGGDVPLAYEIDGGAATIAAVTGHWPVTLAYPKGSYTSAVLAVVEACGNFKMAVIQGNSAYESWPWRFAVPRFQIDDSYRPAKLLSLVQDPPLPATPKP